LKQRHDAILEAPVAAAHALQIVRAGHGRRDSSRGLENRFFAQLLKHDKTSGKTRSISQCEIWERRTK
jgi:hypothetical protein